MTKRPLSSLTVSLTPRPSKRTKLEAVSNNENKVGKYDSSLGMIRSSNLQHPTMILEGHNSELYTCKFSPDGVNLATAGKDKQILIWRVYGECNNHTTLKGHKNSILQLNWSGGSDLLFSASVDKTCSIWNVEYGYRLKQIKSHSSYVNSIYPTKKGTQFIATGSDDGTAKIFDIRMKLSLKTFDNTYQVTSVALLNNARKMLTGSIDNSIKVWDGRKTNKPIYLLNNHIDTITSLTISNDESYLLSNGMDNKLCIWDIRPFIGSNNKYYQMNNNNNNNGKNTSINNRLIKILSGHSHGNEKLLIKSNWNKDGTIVCSGSSNKFSYVWDVHSGKLMYALPGHKGSCNEVDYHPLEDIIVSCSSDKTIYLGEL